MDHSPGVLWREQLGKQSDLGDINEEVLRRAGINGDGLDHLRLCGPWTYSG